MGMRKYIQDIYRVLTNDETLLRLLYYLPVDGLDSPLDTNKENILDKLDKWDIILDRIVTSPKVDDLLDTEPKCRLLFYAGRRQSTNNYLLSSQEMVFDVLVHFDFDSVDQRQSWICDRINELICNKENITGIGKILFQGANGIGAPKGYVGYRMSYSLGSGNEK